MTWKDGRKIIEMRRERVSHLRLRGMSVREIVAFLPKGTDEKPGMVNPETHEPYGLGTIARDFLALDKQYRENAARNTAEHKAEQLAELAEVEVAAWAAKKLDIVRACIMDRAKILGTAAPLRIDTRQLPDPRELTPEQCERILAGEDILTVLHDNH